MAFAANTRCLLRIAALCALLIPGCGGGGGSSSTSMQSVGIFATDSFNDQYDQVWVTLYKVELLTASGTATTVRISLPPVGPRSWAARATTTS